MNKIFTAGIALLMSAAAFAAPQKEKLGRGAVAVQSSSSKVALSWRSFEADDPKMAFDVYKNGEKMTSTPITKSTFYSVAGSVADNFEIKALVNNEVVETFSPVAKGDDVYVRLHLDRPEGGQSPSGGDHGKVSYTYSPNDCSVGDVDGDGEYEIIVKWDPSNSADNSQRWYTGNVYLDCYKLDGTKLWRIDLGCNIRAGAHYTQFLVYDFDGDGKAELACKTAPGTIDGQGKAVLMGNDKVTDDYRDSNGLIMKGSEYLTVFNGQTGAEITTVSYVPLRTVHPQDKSSVGWGDNYGNRSERYLACVAYLDGQKPSIVMCRGYYTHSYLCAWDFDGKNLTQRWLHASTTKGQGAYGEGNHNLSVGDVDGDGCDEIIYGSAAIDHDGSLLYRTGAGHGDAMHLGDLDPDNPGLEVFTVHEEKGSDYKYDCLFREAGTGKPLWFVPQSGTDVGRGMSADIDASVRGYESWGTAKAMFDCKGNQISTSRPSTCFRVYWDGDMQDELFDGRYNSGEGKAYPELTYNDGIAIDFSKYNAQTCNTTKANPCLSADILGDWREEIILWDGNNSSDLLIFTTTSPSEYKIGCLMEDHVYRMGVAWQNVAYNQPPHLGFYLPDRYDLAPAIMINEGPTTQTVVLGQPMKTVKGSWKNMAKVTIMASNGIEYEIDQENKTFTIFGTPTRTTTVRVNSSRVSPSFSTNIVVNVVEPVELERVAYYPFEEVGATVENKVEGVATVFGAPTTVEGKKGNAINFDGISDYLSQTAYDKIQLGDESFTIEFWFKSTDDAAYILHKGSIKADAASGTTGHWFGIELKNGALNFAVDDNETKSGIKSENASKYFDGNWHYMVCVRDRMAKQIRMYVDAELIGEIADNTGALADNNEPFVIGNVAVDLNNFYAGALDELSIYKGAMSVEEIAQNFANSGIEDVTIDEMDGPVRLTLVNARGTVVATGWDDVEALTRGVAPGVYILMRECRGLREVTKLIL